MRAQAQAQSQAQAQGHARTGAAHTHPHVHQRRPGALPHIGSPMSAEDASLAAAADRRRRICRPKAGVAGTALRSMAYGARAHVPDSAVKVPGGARMQLNAAEMRQLGKVF